MSLAMAQYPSNNGAFYGGGGGWDQGAAFTNGNGAGLPTGANNWEATAGWDSYNTIWQNFRDSNSRASSSGNSPGAGNAGNAFGSYYLQQPSVSFYASAAVPQGSAASTSTAMAAAAGGPGMRRGLTELNHNKAITKRLAAAVHYQQVRALGHLADARSCSMQTYPWTIQAHVSRASQLSCGSHAMCCANCWQLLADPVM